MLFLFSFSQLQIYKSYYHLRNKSISYYKYQNDNDYIINSGIKNNKTIDINYPQPQVSSTASCTFKNDLTYFEEFSDSNRSKEINKIFKKRKRNKENKDFDYDEIYFKNKKVKI